MRPENDHPLVKERLFRLREGLLETTLDSPSRWACVRRKQAFRGEDVESYSLRRYPYLKAMYDSPAPFNFIRKGAQMGMTEFAVNKALYWLIRKNKDVMYVLPTEERVREFSKTRIAVAARQSEYLKSKLQLSEGTYMCGHHTLYMRGAIARSGLVSVPVSALVLDEVDTIDDASVRLADERLSGAPDPQLLMLSTPTYPGVGIDAKISESTENNYFFRCPGCSKMIRLEYPDGFVLCGDSESDARTAESHWKCLECGYAFRDSEEIIDQCRDTGEWVPQNTKASPEYQGWYIHQGYSPQVPAPRFAAKVHASMRSADANREFHNSVLALPFSEASAQISDEDINRCLRQYTIAEGVKHTGQGVEVRVLGNDPGNPHHWVVVAFRLDPDLEGDINQRSRGRLIGYGQIEETENPWVELHRLGLAYRIAYAATDLGGDSAGARQFAAAHRGGAMAIRYSGGLPAKAIRITEDENAHIACVDRNSWLSCTFNRVFSERLELPSDLSLEFREQMKTLVRTISVDKKGMRRREYIRPGGRADHWMHALNYAEIGLKLFEDHSPRVARDNPL